MIFTIPSQEVILPQRLTSFLDADRFEGRYRDSVHAVDTDGLMRRMVKEELLTFEGKPLFQLLAERYGTGQPNRKVFVYAAGGYYYPGQGLEALQANPGSATNWNGPYLKKAVPKDPWGNAYKYRCCPGQHGEYDLWSEGADGAPGGEGENADVTSWDAPQK